MRAVRPDDRWQPSPPRLKSGYQEWVYILSLQMGAEHVAMRVGRTDDPARRLRQYEEDVRDVRDYLVYRGYLSEGATARQTWREVHKAWLRGRLPDPWRSKAAPAVWDRTWWYVCTDAASASELERALIRTLRPPCNVQHNDSGYPGDVADARALCEARGVR